MLKILVVIFSALIFFQGCGSDSETQSSGDGDPSGGSNNPPPLEVIDLEAQFIDSYWLPGGRNYTVYADYLAVSHNAGVSLLNINALGLVESEIRASSTLTDNIVSLTSGEIVTLMGNHVRVNSLESNILDVIHMTETSRNLSQVILASSGNCAYWVDRGTNEAPQDKVNQICLSSQSATILEEKFATENWIENIFFLEEGAMVVFERLPGQHKISLFSSDFSLVDEYVAADQLYGFDVEYRNGSIFFSGFTSIWKMEINPNGLSQPHVFHEAVDARGANGTNEIAVHDRGVFIANNNFIYSYDLNGDEIASVYRIDVGQDIEALVVYKEYLIVSYWDNVDFRIYRISDLL